MWWGACKWEGPWDYWFQGNLGLLRSKEGSFKLLKCGLSRHLLVGEGCGLSLVWEVGQPTYVTERVVGSDRVRLGKSLKEGRAFGRRISSESWGVEEQVFFN